MATKKTSRAGRQAAPKPAQPERDSAIHLRPGRIKQDRVQSKAFRTIMKMVRDGKRGRASRARNTTTHQAVPRRPRFTSPHKQQCAVRLTYSANDVAGRWGAHGRYLEREGASGRKGQFRGFGPDSNDVAIAKTLTAWERAGDPRLFKMIISPGEGRRLDLKEFTREYLEQVGKALGTKLQWVAADHYNTDDPHVHVAIRGVTDRQLALVFPPDFVKGPLRGIAGDLATRKLGYRTQQQIESQRERQIGQQRFTELDRILVRQAMAHATERTVDYSQPLKADAPEASKELRMQLLRRLGSLEGMGLAARVGVNTWELDPALETVLRDRQQLDDRLKSMYQQRAVASDPRLPLAPIPAGDARIVGRLLGTGYDDHRQTPYMLVENVGGSVHYLYQTSSAEKARRNGLKLGDLLVITQRPYTDKRGRPQVSQAVRALGAADDALQDTQLLEREVRAFVRKHAFLPEATPWGGWLGSYRKALAATGERMLAQGKIQEREGHYSVVQRERPVRGQARSGPGRSTP